MTKEEIISLARTILAEHLGIDVEYISPEKRLSEDLGADSLDVVEEVMSIEDAFHISIPDEEIENLRTVGDFYDLLEKIVK